MSTLQHNYTGYATQGTRYDRDLSLKDIAKLVRKELKTKFPKCKFSVTTEYYSMGQSLHISLMAGPFEVLQVPERDSFSHPISDTEYAAIKERHQDLIEHGAYHQLNEYQFDKYDGINNGMGITSEAWNVLKGAVEIVNSFNFNDSDGQIDYFNVNFYTHFNIGKYDKPYNNTALVPKR